MKTRLINVAHYNEEYSINRNGEVYSIAKRRFLKPTISVKGYHILNLNKKTRYLHQLLVETFIDPDYKSKGLCVDHIDRNPLNNRLDNLRLVTKSENGKNVDRPFKLCIFKRGGGTFRVIHKGIDKSFKTYPEALIFRMQI